MGISWFFCITILLGVHTCADNKELTTKIHREAWLFCNNLLTNHIENFIMAECPGVKTWNFQCRGKISCSFSSCHSNFHHQFHNGVTVTDIKRDMSVTEELGHPPLDSPPKKNQKTVSGDPKNYHLGCLGYPKEHQTKSFEGKI